MSGKLSGSTFGTQSFESTGKFTLMPPEPKEVDDTN